MEREPQWPCPLFWGVTNTETAHSDFHHRSSVPRPSGPNFFLEVGRSYCEGAQNGRAAILRGSVPIFRRVEPQEAPSSSQQYPDWQSALEAVTSTHGLPTLTETTQERCTVRGPHLLNRAWRSRHGARVRYARWIHLEINFYIIQ